MTRTKRLNKLAKLADQIAEELFTNTKGEVADRMALLVGGEHSSGRYIGGWSQASMGACIYYLLKETKSDGA